MIEVNPRNIRTWSMLGQRGAFGQALLSVADDTSKIYGLSADLCNTSGMDRFAAKYPDRFIQVGIAEQNLIGVAAGLADAGAIPFATTFANFISLRACEQVRHFLGYMECNVKIVGLGAGFAMEYFGNTHYGIEDIATIRSMSNITILSPADGLEVVKCVEAAAKVNGPVYIRLTGVMNQPPVHKEDFDFKIGKVKALRNGKDIAIFATGSMVIRAMKVAETLSESGIDASVIDVMTIKPLEADEILAFSGVQKFVTIEEHSTVGGLGGSVAEIMADSGCSIPLLRLGIEQGYKHAGDYEYMLSTNNLSVDSITEKIKSFY